MVNVFNQLLTVRADGETIRLVVQSAIVVVVRGLAVERMEETPF